MISCIVCNTIARHARSKESVIRKGVRAVANEKNLKPISSRTPRERSEMGRKGAEVANRKKAARKTLKEELLLLLSQGDTQNRMSLALIEKAMTGDTKAFEVIRDSIGEKPTDKIEQSGEVNSTVTVKIAGDAQSWGK